MKRFALILLALLLPALTLGAQAVDSTLVGHSILSDLGSGVRVNQSQRMRNALDRYVQDGPSKKIPGYRIRVFFGSDRNARARSEGIVAGLQGAYPDHEVYRSFESPNFKVTIGDFRSRDEALQLFNQLKGQFPTALIIKENIRYPN